MRLVTASAWLACALVAAAVGATARQGLTGLQANWRDLETWSHVVEPSKQNELGLGLQPQGGGVIAFLGRLSIANPRTPPTEIRVQVATAYLANSNVIRTRSLTFLADAGTDERTTLDLSQRLQTDDDSPGGIIQNGVAPMRAADFVRLTGAKTLTANILGLEVVFRPDQIRAMGEFAERLYLKKKP